MKRLGKSLVGPALFFAGFSVLLLVSGGNDLVLAQEPPLTNELQFPIKGEWSPISRDHNVWIPSMSGYHLGQDIALERETPVYPMTVGIVKSAVYLTVASKPKTWSGYVVFVEHNFNEEILVSVYYHLRKPRPEEVLKAGDIVSINKPLGYVSGDKRDHGNTIPHLHFGIRKGKYLPGRDPRTNVWYYPGYTTIYPTLEAKAAGKPDYNPDNPVHAQIAAEWLKPSDFIGKFKVRPNIDFFAVSPNSFVLSNSLTVSYRVSDAGGSGFNRVELWRANDDSGPVDWQEMSRVFFSGNSHTGSFIDTPSLPGTYWYGAHVVDGAGNWSVEPNPPGPVKVTVIPLVSISTRTPTPAATRIAFTPTALSTPTAPSTRTPIPTLAASPTAIATRTVTPSPPEQRDKTLFDEYFTSIEVIKVPRVEKWWETDKGTWTPTTIIRDGEQPCLSFKAKKDAGNVYYGIYNTQSQRYITSTPRYAVIQVTSKPDSVGCFDAMVVPVPKGKYEYRIWIGDTLVAALPFEVQ